MLSRRGFLGGLAAIGSALGFGMSANAPEPEPFVGIAMTLASHAGASVRLLHIDYGDTTYAKIALLGDVIPNVCRDVEAGERITPGDLVEIGRDGLARLIVMPRPRRALDT